MLKLTKILTRRALSKEKLKSQKYISPNPEFLNPKNWSKTEPKSLSYTTRDKSSPHSDDTRIMIARRAVTLTSLRSKHAAAA